MGRRHLHIDRGTYRESRRRECRVCGFAGVVLDRDSRVKRLDSGVTSTLQVTDQIGYNESIAYDYSRYYDGTIRHIYDPVRIAGCPHCGNYA